MAIALNWGNVRALAKFKESYNEKDLENVRIMSYNVNLFGYYRDNAELNKDEIISFIESSEIDILCLQEYFQYDSKGFKVKDNLNKILKLKYSTQIQHNQKYEFGVVIFSKHKIINEGKLDFGKKKANSCVFADIVVNKDTVRVFNFHLESIRFNKEDEYAYNDFMNLNSGEISSAKNRATRILRKLKISFQKRAEQAHVVKEAIAQSPYPVVVCGDMNDTPISYSYKIVRGDLKDAFLENGFGLGTTYNGIFPSFRIDYFFYSKSITNVEYHLEKLSYSDHYPIIGEFVLDKNNLEK